MTASVFLESIEKFIYLGPLLIARLRSLCPFLEENERANAIARIQPINESLEQNRKEALEIAKDNIAISDRARREFMPQIHAAVEDDERSPVLEELSRQMAL